MVRPVSTPQPRARGVAASKASRVRHRMPGQRLDRGPARSSTRSRGGRHRRRCRARRHPAAAAGARSTCRPLPRGPGRTSGAVLTADSARSPSMNSESRGGRPGASRMATMAAPVSIAAALPRLCEWRTTTAPASRATSWVPSSLPSSTTSTRSTCGIARAARTVAAMRSDLVLGRDDHRDALPARSRAGSWYTAERALRGTAAVPPVVGVPPVARPSSGP